MSARFSIKSWCGRMLIFAVLVLAPLAKAEDVASAFNEANKLYEQGRFSDAAAGYEKIINSGSASSRVYFNLGNAYLKSGQMGRAIVAYLNSEKLSPRDPDVHSNLQFARDQAGGGTGVQARRWQNGIAKLTLDEWTILTSIGVSVFFLLLALRQWRASWRNSFRGILLCLGIVCAFLLVCLMAAIRQEFSVRSAVIIVSEAVVRPGPFEESPSAFTLRDGTEVTVVGQKDNWLEIADAGQRTGWLPGKNVMQIGNPKR